MSVNWATLPKIHGTLGLLQPWLVYVDGIRVISNQEEDR